MAKSRTQFICQQCGFITTKWFGKCPECQAWDSLQEEHAFAEPTKTARKTYAASEPSPIHSLDQEKTPVIAVPYPELARVLGGGLVPGAITLLGGDPGVGKSTLLLQFLGRMHEQGSIATTLYVSAEESAQQIKLRAKRLGVQSDGLMVYAETSLPLVLQQIERLRPAIVVIDSVQTVYSPELTSIPGSISQVREVADQLVRIGKQSHTPIFLVGHVTKEGGLAGPKTLEHLVDTVLQFEGERDQTYRILRCHKNRFGPTDEIGVFEMKGEGLEEVANPSALFLRERPADSPGSIVHATLEGSRPLLVEVQGLTSRSSYGVPMRNAVGFDKNRLTMLLAVLEKRAGVDLSAHDVYVNIVGGLRLTEPAADLAVCCAVLSSLHNTRMETGTVVFGEVGLSGEVRTVPQQESRLKEARKLGFGAAYLPPGKQPDRAAEMELHAIRSVSDLLAKAR